MIKISSLFTCILLMLVSKASFAGQGRDGTWPNSIALYNHSRQELIKAVANLSVQDINFITKDLKDRDSHFDINNFSLRKWKKVVKFIEKADVETIEGHDYDGIRLFYYDNSIEASPRIFATKNFYNNPKYQVKKINPDLVKEVQFMMLRELAHIFGLGEDGAVNYAQIFSERFLNTIYDTKITLKKDSGAIYQMIAQRYDAELNVPEYALLSFKDKFLSCYEVNRKSITKLKISNLDSLKIDLGQVKTYQGETDGAGYSYKALLIGKKYKNYIICHRELAYLNLYLGL